MTHKILFLGALILNVILAQHSPTEKSQAPEKTQAEATKEALDAHFTKTLSEGPVLESLTKAITQAHSFITEYGEYPYKTYPLTSSSNRFAMRGMTYQVAKQLQEQPSLKEYFKLTKKVENIFHELRFENVVKVEDEKVKGNFFQSYFRLRYPNSERSFVYMMEWNPQDKSTEGLKLYSVQGAEDAWKMRESASLVRIATHREEIKALSKAHSELKDYWKGLQDTQQSRMLELEKNRSEDK